MKKITIFLLLLFLSAPIMSLNYNDYIKLNVGNKFFYNCWVVAQTNNGCSGLFKMKVVITGTAVYSGKTYFTYSKEILRLSGTCDFEAFMFPFNEGPYNALRIDSINGMIYYYNPASSCSYLPNETMLDSLRAGLNDTVRIRCVQYPYLYRCIDTTGIKKFYNNSSSYPGQIRREYTHGVGLFNNYQYKFIQGFTFVNEQTLIGRVVNGIVYGDTNFNFVGIEKVGSFTPDNFSLHQNYPNPFNPVTKIRFDIPSGAPSGIRGKSPVELQLYNSLGQLIETLVNEQLSPGTYEVTWDGINYPSGVYFYKLKSGDFTESRKMLLIK